MSSTAPVAGPPPAEPPAVGAESTTFAIGDRTRLLLAGLVLMLL